MGPPGSPATLAQAAGAGDALIAAALLHDIGHLASGLGGTPSAAGIDDAHEAIGAELLRPLFGAEVVEPVRLHVQAKRCLALTPAYLTVLSADSRRSLALQGGPMDAAAAAAFRKRPFADDAVRLRRWDDGAKTARLPTPPLDALWSAVERVALRRSTAG